MTLLFLAVMLLHADLAVGVQQSPKWSVEFFNIDGACTASLNGQPIASAIGRDNTAVEFTRNLKQPSNSFSIVCTAGSRYGAYGYEVDLDGTPMTRVVCGMPGQFDCLPTPVVSPAPASTRTATRRIVHSRAMILDVAFVPIRVVR